MAEIEVNGIRLYYEEHGEGEPIACIHGAGSTAMLWSDAIAKLARLGRVIAYDRRGCSRSERPEAYESTTVGEQGDDAAALLNALGATPAIVIARSYGGAVAVDLALRRPEAVRALVLLEGDALGLSPEATAWTRGLLERLRAVADRDGIDAVYPALIEEPLGQGAWDSFPEAVRAALTENGVPLLAELGYVDEDLPDADSFASINCPALLVSASDSPAKQRAMTDAMAAVLPNATTASVSGGHLVDPAAPEVLEFVGSLLGGD